jgi:TolA-binding protein
MSMRAFKNLFSVLCFALAIGTQAFGADFSADYNLTYQEYQAAKTGAQIETVADKFLKLADRDDSGALKANSIYWAAECYYDLKNYLKALNCFEKVLLLPQSNKEEAARYKVAVCYARLGWTEAARWELNRFVRDFPSSSLAGKAKNELNSLGK